MFYGLIKKKNYCSCYSIRKDVRIKLTFITQTDTHTHTYTQTHTPVNSCHILLDMMKNCKYDMVPNFRNNFS